MGYCELDVERPIRWSDSCQNIVKDLYAPALNPKSADFFGTSETVISGNQLVNHPCCFDINCLV